MGSPSERPPVLVHMIAGGLGGMCGAIVTAPFDMVKTRLQSDLFMGAVRTNTKTGVRGLLQNFADTVYLMGDIYRTEGPSSLVKGLGPTLVGVVPARSLNFFVYGNGKHLYSAWFNGGEESALVHLAAALTAGVTTAFATNPLWVVKTIIQLESQPRAQRPTSLPLPEPQAARPLTTFSQSHSTHLHAVESLPPRLNATTVIRDIFRTQGIRGFYRGLSASMIGVSEGTIQWTLYEQFKRLARKRSESENGGWLISAAAGSAKLIATVITYPHEVVRTRLRQPDLADGTRKYHSLFQTFGVIFREEGWRSFYGGLSPHLMRVIPNAVTMFFVYERVLLHFQPRPSLERRGD